MRPTKAPVFELDRSASVWPEDSRASSDFEEQALLRVDGLCVTWGDGEEFCIERAHVFGKEVGLADVGGTVMAAGWVVEAVEVEWGCHGRHRAGCGGGPRVWRGSWLHLGNGSPCV